MDLLMPGLDGIAATAEIKARHPAIEVVAITSFIEEDRVTAAIEAGASGFLLKDAEADDLAAAIRAAHAGEVYLDPAVAGIVARRDAGGSEPARRRARTGPTRAVDRLTAPRARRPGLPRARPVEPGDRRRSSGWPSGRRGPTSRTSWPSSA